MRCATYRNLMMVPPWCMWLSTLPNPRTRSNYEYDLRLFNHFLNERGIPGPHAAGPQDLARFMGWLLLPGTTPGGKQRDPMSARSIRRVQCSLSGFYAHMVAGGMMDRDSNPTPILKTLRMRFHRQNPRPLPEVDRAALLRAMVWRTFEERRNAVAILLGFHSGFRVSEVAAMRMSDMDLRDFTATQVGKGGKRRTVPLSRLLVRWLVGYMVARSKKPGMHNSPWLFPSPMDVTRHISSCRLQAWLKRVARRAGIPHWDRVTVHQLRHSFCTQLAETGGNAYHIMVLAGHNSIDTSQEYVNLAENSRGVREAHDRAFDRPAAAEAS
ncbi:MAG TPA: tyrosine-type recombinase/integrase [bacterium]|nr:tyrosine-type recombinase/integrase [bacterium]